MGSSSQSVSELIHRVRLGDEGAMRELLPLVYGELRALARKQLRREYGHRSLQTMDLVNDACLRLLPADNLQVNDKAHFLAIAARSMRQILVERARANQAKKRGGPDAHAVTLHENLLGRAENTVDVLVLEEALAKLAGLNEFQAKLVELRFYGGMTVDETAAALESSPATVKRHWSFAQAWLRRELGA